MEYKQKYRNAVSLSIGLNGGSRFHVKIMIAVKICKYCEWAG